MEGLTPILHKSKETKNKVVYGTTPTAASSRAPTSTRTRWETHRRPLSRSSYLSLNSALIPSK